MYSEIRNKQDFLYLYFIKKTGNNIPKDMFYSSLGIWLEMFIRVDFQTGVKKITEYLDKINTN